MLNLTKRDIEIFFYWFGVIFILLSLILLVLVSISNFKNKIGFLKLTYTKRYLVLLLLISLIIITNIWFWTDIEDLKNSIKDPIYNIDISWNPKIVGLITSSSIFLILLLYFNIKGRKDRTNIDENIGIFSIIFFCIVVILIAIYTTIKLYRLNYNTNYEEIIE